MPLNLMGKAAEWLISKDPILLGSDNFPVEVSPNPDPKLSSPVHQIALVVNGVHLLENLKLDELVGQERRRICLHHVTNAEGHLYRLI